MSKVGRPRKYDDPKEMAEDISSYFSKCERDEKPKTVAGLASALDMTRKTLNEYQKLDEFCNTIEKAKQVIESDINEKGLQGEYVASMAKFNLKNNFNWEDKQRKELSGPDGEPIKTESQKDDKLAEKLENDENLRQAYKELWRAAQSESDEEGSGQ